MGSIFGALDALCGSRLPGLELAEAVGNSFGRGPLVYRFPPAALAQLRQRCARGSAWELARFGGAA